MSGEQWGEAVDAADELAPTPAIRAAADALFAWNTNQGLHFVMHSTGGTYDEIAWRVLEAAAPLIVADTRREVAEEITDNVRNADFAKQYRGGFVGFTERMAYVAGHDKAAAIARGSGNGDSSGQEPEACASGTESDRDGRDPTDACRRMQ